MALKPSRKPILIFSAVAMVIVGAIVLTIGGFAFAASQESHDSFCASCHTLPESTFYQRSTGSAATDLASFHTAKTTGCIDCHSGAGITGRVAAELLGAGNAFKWYTGTAVQPAVLKVPIGDANCLKCHGDVTTRGFMPKENFTSPVGGGSSFGGFGGEREGRNNHWHAMMAQWQAASPSAGTCVSCHSGHATSGTAANGFMDSQAVQTTCDACHQVLRHEGNG